MEENVLKQKTLPKKEVVEYAAKKKILADEKAVELLCRQSNFRELMNELSKEKHFFLDEETVNAALIKQKSKTEPREEVVIEKTHFKPYAKEIRPDLNFLTELDVTNQSCSEGKVGDFLNYFREKFSFLESLLKQRQGLEPKPISFLKKIPKGEKIDLIGMVSKKWVSKNGNRIIQIEDLEGNCLIVISKDNEKLMAEGEAVLLDDVIAVKASKLSDEMIIASEVIWPDLPQKNFKKARREVSIASISDMHVGSKLFLEKEFSRFLSWLNGGIGAKKELTEIGKIKYLIIAGDNVDGVGIYPDQFDELAIKDIYKQYELFSKYIQQIPEYIEVIICPGQHDAVRRADPQPAIQKEFVKELSELKNIHFIGSPSWFEVEGLKTVVYHGASLHDLYASVNFLNAREPQKAIIELLKRRDLMPSYGLRQPYIPEKKDFMLVKECPDLYFGADMHHSGYAQYKGCLIINNSTWQTQTPYQLEQGHIPTPGIVPVIDLKTGKIKENHFFREEDE